MKFIILIIAFLFVKIYTLDKCSKGSFASDFYSNNTVKTCKSCVNGSTYTEYDNKLQRCLSCSSCEHNMEVLIPCTTIKNTQCQCMEGTYYDQMYQTCIHCSSCENTEKIIVNCTKIHDTVCGCKDGYYNKDGICIHCSYCYLGEGVKTPCSNTTDTICELCNNGMYSANISFTEVCMSYTMCILGLTSLNFNVTWFDNICINCSMPYLEDIGSLFTIKYITFRRLPNEDLQNLFRLTYNHTRKDVDFVTRDDIEGSFSFTSYLPHQMQKLDYQYLGNILQTYYNNLTYICDTDY